MIIDWVAPFNNGSPITHYSVLIQAKDGVFKEELSDCDGSDPAIVSVTSCRVLLDTLTSGDFNIALGDNVNV